MNLQDLIKSGNYTFIDVREPIELEMDGAIDQALNIPLGELEDRLQEIKNIATPKIVFCKSGGRSSSAVQFLISFGLQDSINGGGYAFVQMLLEQNKKIETR